MTEQELRQKAIAIKKLFREEVTDEEIICQIKETPEVIHVKLPATTNLFIEAVMSNRFEVTKVLVEMGSDIHLKCEPSLICGNALNVASSPEQADYLLGLGIEIEKNLYRREPFVNPAIMAAGHNEKTMLLYWLSKEKEIFADDEAYVKELIHQTIYQVRLMNQYDMLSCIMSDENLYHVLKEVYSNVDNEESIKLIQSALRSIKDEALEGKKKELRKILNARKKELAATTQN